MAAAYADAAVAGEAGEEQQEVVVGGPHVISMLEQMGVAASDIKKLQEAGIHTIEGLSHAPMKRLVAIKGLTEAKIQKLKTIGAPRGAGGKGSRGARFGLTAFAVAAQRARSCRKASPRRAPSSCSGATPSSSPPAARHWTTCSAVRARTRPAPSWPCRCGADRRLTPRRSPRAGAQAAWSPGPSPRFTASSARARRRSATCSPSRARHARQGRAPHRRAVQRVLSLCVRPTLTPTARRDSCR